MECFCTRKCIREHTCYNERATKYVLLILHFIAEESLQVISTVVVDQNDGCAKLSLADIQIMRSVTHENAI